MCLNNILQIISLHLSTQELCIKNLSHILYGNLQMFSLKHLAFLKISTFVVFKEFNIN